jgi:hypothetical protein
MGWPDFIGRTDKCQFNFEWRSKWACTQCKLSDVRSVETSCVSGVRTTAYISVEKCIIVYRMPNLDDTAYISPSFLAANASTKFIDSYSVKSTCDL